MKALVIVLNQENCLEDVLSVFVDNGVKGATIVDSQGMASAIVSGDISSIPLYGSLKTLLRGRNPYSKTIFSVIDNDEKLARVVEDVRELLKEAPKPGGFMFTIPVDDMFLLN